MSLIGVHLTPRISHRNLPQRLLKAREALMAHFRPILHRYGLTDQQWRILRVLDEHAQLEPRELCSLCQIHSASMTGMLARMEELGLVERQRVPGDQRRVLIRLATKGDQLVREMAPLIDLQYQHIEQALGAPLLDELLQALEAFLAVQHQPIQAVQWPLKEVPTA